MSLLTFPLPFPLSVIRQWQAPASIVPSTLEARNTVSFFGSVRKVVVPRVSFCLRSSFLKFHTTRRSSNGDHPSFAISSSIIHPHDRPSRFLQYDCQQRKGMIDILVCTLTVVALLSLDTACLPVFALGTSATPYSQSLNQKMQIGLLNGRIRPCPSDINPNCISTSSKNATYAIPWRIPPEASENAARKIATAILSTQRNSRIMRFEDTPNGQFVQAEVDSTFGHDVLEFLVKDDVVTYRSMAEKVIYVYPFTTPLGDFGTQRRRIEALEDELGWSVMTWNSSY